MKVPYIYTILTFLSFVGFLELEAQEIKGAKKASKGDQLAKSLLWEVTGNGIEKPSFVFGTIHIINAEDYFFPDIAKETFADAPQVAFEIDMDDMSDMSNMFSIMQDAMMKDGQTLKTLLSEEDYELVANHFNEMGLPLMMLERIKPMFLSVLTSGDVGIDGMQSGEVVSYEMKLYEQAQEAGKLVEGLETMQFQMGLFDSIPYEAQAQMLVDGIRTGDTENDEFDKMIEMYKNQDIESMHKMIEQDSEGLSDFENLLVRKRNENWIPKMKVMMEKDATFFAVGAGHLGGPFGVIRLLKEAGYTVLPLMHVKGVRRI